MEKSESAPEPVTFGRTSRWSLTGRILAVNIFALMLLAGGFFYLDSFRVRMLDQRASATIAETRLVAQALEEARPDMRAELLRRAGQMSGMRLRLYSADGRLLSDSWQGAVPTYQLRDPNTEPWQRHAARFLDRVIDRVAGAERYESFIEPTIDRASAWPEVVRTRRTGQLTLMTRRAPDRTPVISAAVTVAEPAGSVLLSTINAREVIRTVRAERLRLGLLLAFITLLSVLLSLFLARTIVRPLRRLARAAHRVRLGRAREVQVPRLPSRHDEIGLLARAVSDMSLALRQRIDATEAFAADVAHELKNPLASLRSAVDSLAMVKDPALQEQLIAIIRDDVVRLDRLITDISEASRLDAELSRTRFEPVDVGAMIEGIIRLREQRGLNGDAKMAYARPRVGSAVVNGDGSRLARAIENLISNAVSFSPPGGLVQIGASRVGDEVIIRVEDSGPGVPPEAREEIFNRFHSLRPSGEEFGKHSGLGLAIARAIVDGHHGKILVHDRDDGAQGASFVIHLPAMDAS